MGPGAMILVSWMLSFKPAFSLSSFTYIMSLFSSSSLYAIRVVSSAYLRLLIFLLAILIPACASSSMAFCTMYFACKLNKQGDNIQPWHTPFPIWNQYVVPCPVLTVTSWPTYRFLRRQVRWSGSPISLRIFHSLLWSTQSKAYYYRMYTLVGHLLHKFFILPCKLCKHILCSLDTYLILNNSRKVLVERKIKMAFA